MGFLPADDPEVIVYVAVDNAKGITQYGGTIAAPIVREVMLSAIDALNIKKSSGGSEMEYRYTDKKYYDVPDVTNMTVKEAVKALKNFKVEYTGTGEKVIYQSPKSGKRALEGETITLLLN